MKEWDCKEYFIFYLVVSTTTKHTLISNSHIVENG
jgi:hypothetical protein